MQVPCGKCIGCRLDRSQDWATRCMHEAQLHPFNSFLTLTYEDKQLPEDYSVHVRPLQLFLKKLRERVGNKIRFFACGEYGSDDYTISETPQRPHFHLLTFNYRPNDLKLYKKSNDTYLYTSENLSKIWTHGFSTIGDVNFQTAAYCARYNIKKRGGDQADEYYTRIHPLSGNLVRVQPEFSTQSRRPGIGHKWFETFKSDVYPSDFVVDQDGRKHAVPKYYHRLLAEEELKNVKRRRKAIANTKRADNTPARLRTRETVQLAKAALLKRNLK